MTSALQLLLRTSVTCMYKNLYWLHNVRTGLSTQSLRDDVILCVSPWARICWQNSTRRHWAARLDTLAVGGREREKKTDVDEEGEREECLERHFNLGTN